MCVGLTCLNCIFFFPLCGHFTFCSVSRRAYANGLFRLISVCLSLRAQLLALIAPRIINETLLVSTANSASKELSFPFSFFKKLLLHTDA
jgi:hypothetical protein